MMFVKARKLRNKMVVDAWNGELFFEAMDANNIQYRLVEIDRNRNLKNETIAWASIWNWDPDKIIINWVNSISKKDCRLVMLINYPDMDSFFSIINRTIKLKVFL